MAALHHNCHIILSLFILPQYSYIEILVTLATPQALFSKQLIRIGEVADRGENTFCFTSIRINCIMYISTVR
jgi:predicted DNA-binding ribbon-helix-helix protein